MEHLYRKLKEYGQSEYYPFHMPGHKRNSTLTGARLPYEIDITEIDGFDDLHHAEGILKEAQEYAAEVYHAEETHYLINGSTVGLLSAVMGCANQGDLILMARNCHKSVYHAVMLNKLEAVYIYPRRLFHINEGFESSEKRAEEDAYGDDLDQELNGEIDPGQIAKLLEENPSVRAVVITSPTYDGVVSDVKQIAAIVHEKGIPLIVDEAHGAHFGFHPYFPQNSNQAGADVVIHSLHKTLPSMTQTALLHMNGNLVDRESVRDHLHMLQSSSPSYVLMASMDECVRLIGERGSDVFERYAEHLESVRTRLQKLRMLQLVESEKYDKSKIVIMPRMKSKKFTGKLLYNILKEKYLLQPEMAAGSYVVLMTSVGDTEVGLERLVSALEEIDGELAKIERNERNNSKTQDKECSRNAAYCMLSLLENEEADGKSGMGNDYVYTSAEARRLCRECGSESVSWEQCIGRISAEYAYIYPPGIPLIVPGEQIVEKTARRIMEYEKMGFQIEGTKTDGKIEVLING